MIAIKEKIKENKKIILLIIMIICTVVIDQIVKISVISNLYNSSITIIENVLNFTYVENRGGAFGIGSGNLLMFIIVNIIIIVLILKFIVSKKDEVEGYVLISGGLIIAGGIANLIDRIFRGFVIDYIDFSPIIKYPVFNLADIFIVIGCVFVLLKLIINTIKERNAK